MQLQWNSSERRCYNCNQLGHMAWRCPNKSVKINKIEAAKALVVPGKISNQHTDLMIDTGAAMSMVPAKLISSAGMSEEQSVKSLCPQPEWHSM